MALNVLEQSTDVRLHPLYGVIIRTGEMDEVTHTRDDAMAS